MFSRRDARCPEEESILLVLAYHPYDRKLEDKEEWYELLCEEDKKEWTARYVHTFYKVAKDEI